MSTSRFLRNPVGVASTGVLVAIVAAAVAAPLLTPFGPGDSALSDVLAPAGGAHLLGADGSGRDIWTQLLYGARQSLLAGAIATVVAVVIGVPSGLVAGYRGRRLDTAASWVSDLLMSLPAVIVLLAVIARTGPVMPITMVVFGVLTAPFFFRITRAATVAVRHELFIDAARVAGLGDVRILARHVLPSVRGPILIQGALVLGMAIVAQAGLEFLGLGDPATPSWGAMLNDALRNIYVAPGLILYPGIALALTSCALALVGAALSDSLSRRDAAAPQRPARPAAAASGSDSGSGRAAARPDAALSIRALRVSYGDREVVHGIDLDVAAGEILGLVGESGSGKTQIALAALGLLPPAADASADALLIDSVAVGTSGRGAIEALRGKRIGYIPQEPLSNLDPSSTVGSQLTVPMRHHLRISRAEAEKRAIALLDRVGIVDAAATMRRYPHQLSGGMAQRVLIAAAVSCDPVVLVADEPTTALDVTVQAEVLDLIRELQRERGLGVLIVTHNFGVVADLCDRVVVLEHGSIVEQGETAPVLREPVAPYTRTLLGSALDARPTRCERDLDLGAPLSGSADPLLAVDGLVVDYRSSGLRSSAFRALDGVSLTIDRGETVGLVGESGSGKSTLGKVVLGLAAASSGSVRFAGTDLATLGRRERRTLANDIQVVFQDPLSSLDPSMPVEDILVEPLTAQGVRPNEARARVATLLDQVGLPAGSGRRYPAEFSGGQRQRIAIARALALRPRLIICDEPVSALDLSTQVRVLDLLVDLQRETGVAYLFVTHDLDVVRYVSHRVAVLKRGVIVETGDTGQVTTAPQHPYTQRLLLASPVTDPVAQAARRRQRQNAAGAVHA